MFSQKKNPFVLNIPPRVLFDQSIADVFVIQGILDLEDAEKLKKYFKTNRSLENFLIKNHLVTKETVNKAYSIILKLPFIELSNVEIPEEAMILIPERICLKYGVIPFDLTGKMVKIAVTNPADLPLGFSTALSRLFKNKKIAVELFITAPEDFKESIKQYSRAGKNSLLIKKGSLPVVFLRNRQIPRIYLNKIPKKFIEQHRLLVFDENISGDYMVACEKPDSPVTKKILEFLEKENKVTLEVFATSKDDIDYVLENFDQNSDFHVESLQAEEGKEEEATNGSKINLSVLSSISSLLFKAEEPSLTIDSIVPRSDRLKSQNQDNSFPKVRKKTIMINDTGKGGTDGSISLIGKVDQGYLKKLPKDFIQKYRVVVFGENSSGELMLATDSVSELTKKAIDFIKNQHSVELFTVSSSDIDYAINIYT